MVKIVLKSKYDVNKPAEVLKYLRDKRHEYKSSKSAVKIIWKRQVEYLKTLPQPEQLSPEWFEMRKYMLTASDLGKVVGVTTHGNYKDILKKKCGLSKFSGNRYTRFGQKYEEIACQLYSLRHQIEVCELGLIRHHSIPILGASLDGLRTDGIALEIKCPSGRQITGVIPPEYYSQMQAQMAVCDLDECDFLECKFTEYPSYSAYKKDKFNPDKLKQLKILPNQFDLDYIRLPEDRRGKNGLEKGVVAYYERARDDYVYIHPPFDLSTPDQLKFLEKQRVELSGIGIWLEYSYWTLEFSSNQRVKRCHKWWKKYNVEQKLYDCMADIKVKMEDSKWLEDNKPKSRESSFIDLNDTKFEKCAFLDDSDDEE